MIIGIDFDNTIVRYDLLFHKLAVEEGLVPPETEKSKNAVRDFLRRENREDEWTRLQGLAYGSRILEAEPYDGLMDFLNDCFIRGIRVCVISHKTRKPFIGDADLHDAARKWISHSSILEYVKQSDVFLETTKEEKLERIKSVGCDVFIDDLPEILTRPDFPGSIRRVLFDPYGSMPESGEYIKASSWRDVSDQVLLRRSAENLLKLSGLKPPMGHEDISISRLSGGKNNRVFMVGAGGKKFLLKEYFRSAHDTRDRLGTEYSFISFLNASGISQAPRAYAKSEPDNAALYEFIEGRKLLPGEITPERVDEALRFLKLINARKSGPAAKSLPNASEACFTAREHLELVKKRISLLRASHDRELLEFLDVLEKDLSGAIAMMEKERNPGAAPEKELDEQHRILSPSDFGMHNALLKKDNTLSFIDFEYAGWDDPAKTVCDFFCQPHTPIPPDNFRAFAGEIFGNDPEGAKRCALLMGVYEIKWCCIMLNEFLKSGNERRAFSSGAKAGSSAHPAGHRLEAARNYYRQKISAREKGLLDFHNL